MSRFLCFVVVGSIALSTSGCGNGRHPVKGRIHFADGTPLTHGRIVVDLPGGAAAWGLVHPDGSFALGTDSPTDGLPSGTYTAYLQNTETFPPAGHTGSFSPRPLVHRRYGRPETSGLKLEVPRESAWDVTVDRP